MHLAVRHQKIIARLHIYCNPRIACVAVAPWPMNEAPEGIPLADAIAENPTQVWEYFAEAMQILDTIHKECIVHRDIRIENWRLRPYKTEKHTRVNGIEHKSRLALELSGYQYAMDSHTDTAIPALAACPHPLTAMQYDIWCLGMMFLHINNKPKNAAGILTIEGMTTKNPISLGLAMRMNDVRPIYQSKTRSFGIDTGEIKSIYNPYGTRQLNQVMSPVDGFEEYAMANLKANWIRHAWGVGVAAVDDPQTLARTVTTPETYQHLLYKTMGNISSDDGKMDAKMIGHSRLCAAAYNLYVVQSLTEDRPPRMLEHYKLINSTWTSTDQLEESFGTFFVQGVCYTVAMEGIPVLV